MTMHRPFSSLVYNDAELKLSATTFTAPATTAGRSVHTARALKVAEIQTKLLAIPCTIEKHSVFSMAISAQIATAQVASCNLLEDHALSIARDRVRLSIGFLSAMGSIWPVGKAMAKDVRAVARSVVSEPSSLPLEQQESIDEVEIPRDELIWPVDPSANVDIYSGLVLPMDWEQITIGHSGYASSALISAATFPTSAPGDYGS